MVQCFTLLCTIFDRNGTPSTYVPIVVALLTAENASSLKYQ